MAKAIWNSQVIAESDSFEIVEGNVYFPADTIKREFFQDSGHESFCPWKGCASYYTVVVDGESNANAAWYYADPKSAAANIKGHIAFWHGVKVDR